MSKGCGFAIKRLKYAQKLKRLKICTYMQNKKTHNCNKTTQMYGNPHYHDN
jgi:hypothetical protein